MSYKKKLLQLNKNAYLQIDFLFVLLIFSILFFYVYSTYSTSYSSYVQYIEDKSTLEDLDYLCDLLIYTPGQPVNWEQGSLSDTTFFGLEIVNSTILSINKIQTFFNDSYYLSIYNNLNLSDIFYAKLSNSSDVLYTLGEEPQGYTYRISTQCFATFNSSLVSLEVGLWN